MTVQDKKPRGSLFNIEWYLDHGFAGMTLVGLAVLIGLRSLHQIPLEVKPSPKEQGIRVTARWERQIPEVVQRSVTLPLESTVMQIRDIGEVRSSTGQGIAILELEFPASVERKILYTELYERLAIAKKILPRGISISVDPIVNTEGPQKALGDPFFELEVVGPLSLTRLRKIAEGDLVPNLRSVKGVGRIDVYGDSDDRMEIQLKDIYKLNPRLKPARIQGRIEETLNVSGSGPIHINGRNRLLVLESPVLNRENLQQINLDGGVTLGQIATITTQSNRSPTVARHNFNPLVTVRVYKTPGMSALQFASRMRSRLIKFRETLPDSIRIYIASDASQALVSELYSLGIRAICILGVLFFGLKSLFYRYAYPAVIMVSVIISLICSMVFLQWSNATINVVTLAGCALVIGVLVDNGVVVLDSIQKRSDPRITVRNAVYRGTQDVFQPLLASMTTTVLACTALIALEGRLNEMFHSFAILLAASLGISFLLAVTFIPAVVLKWPQAFLYNTTRGKPCWTVPGRSFPEHVMTAKNDRKGWFDRTWNPALLSVKARQAYAIFIRAVIIRWKITLLVSGFVLMFSTVLFWKSVDRNGLIFWGDSRELQIHIHSQAGSPSSVLDTIVLRLEATIRAQKIPGETRSWIHYPSGKAKIKTTFPDSVIMAGTPFVLREKLVAQAIDFSGVGIGIVGFGPPYLNPGLEIQPVANTQLQISGPDYYRLVDIGESVLELARRDSRVGLGWVVPSVRMLETQPLDQIRLDADVKKMWERNISLRELRSAIISHFSIPRVAELTSKDTGTPVVSIQSAASLQAIEQLAQIRLPVEKKGMIILGEVAMRTDDPVLPWIDKWNQQYRFTVAWQYLGPEKMRRKHEKQIVDTLHLPPGYTLLNNRWGLLTAREERSLFFLLCGVVLGMFMILAALYESLSLPLVVLFSVPFALTGVFWIYPVLDRDFNVYGYVGLIFLFGIVVNNAILLVARITQYRRAGWILADAIVQGSSDRIRPILITVLTTVGGLLPVFFLPGGNTYLSRILEELSMIAVAGMTGSVLLTMSLIPVLYYVRVRLKACLR